MIFYFFFNFPIFFVSHQSSCTSSISHKTREAEIDEAVYFLQFYGSELDGKAMSFATISSQIDFEAKQLLMRKTAHSK